MTPSSNVCILSTPRVKEAREKLAKHFAGEPIETRVLAGFDNYIAGDRVKALELLFPIGIVDLAMFLAICKAHDINLRVTIG